MPTPRRDALIVIVSAGVAVALVFFVFAPFRRSAPPPTRSPSPTIQSMRHTNAAAGYSFLRPVGWEVSERGTVSELTAPGGDVIVSFGLGPDGSLRDASTEFVASVADAYEEVQVQGPEREDIAGRSAIVAGGTAVNQAGVAIRFIAIAFRIEGQNYAISVFVADASDPVRVLPSVEDVIASFEPG